MKKLLVPVMAACLLAASCVSNGKSVALSPGSRVDAMGYSAELRYLNYQLDVVYRDNERFLPKQPGDAFAEAKIRFINSGEKDFPYAELPTVELLCRDAETGALSLYPSVLSLDSIKQYDLATTMAELKTPRVMKPGESDDRTLAFVVPRKSEVLGVLFDRLSAIDVVSEGHDGYDDYRARLEKEKNATMVFAAARILGYEVISSMMESYGMDATTEDIRGVTLFQQALVYGNLSVAKGLLGRGADRNATVTMGFGIKAKPVHLATMSGNTDLVAWMLTEGFSIGEPTGDGRPSFEVALRSQSLDMVRFYVEHGIDPSTVRIRMGFNSAGPIKYARQSGLDDIADYLASLGYE